ncbi:MAG: glycine zipper 2TM domain-containing protein [Gammaproteobacteria bacterium]|nr:glycine zipper 2TM domain-containing protein [Gammaproteobacteria bacterium]
MTNPEGRNKTIIAIVTTSVLAVGAVAAAVMTGVISRPAAVAEQTESTPPAPAQAVAPTEAHKRSALKARAPEVKVASAAAPVVCHDCGVVESIESFTEKGQASGGGAVAGGLLGGVIGHQIGKGRGKDLATVAGAVGGAIAGNEIEKNSNKVTHYRVSVRMDDGTRQQLTLNAANDVAVGDKVKIVDGALVRN